MRHPGGIEKLARAAFIATSALVIIAGVVWGIRLLTMLHNQTTTQPANQPTGNAISGFPMSGQRTDQIDVFTTENSCLTIVWATIQDIRLHKILV